MSKPHVICITESWLDTHISDQELSIDGYNIIRRDRNRHGGGVALYISTNLSYKIIFVGTSIECIFVTVEISSCKVNVCVFYCPPSSNVEYLENLYNNLSSFYPFLLNNFILIGDFNIDFLVQNHPHLPHLLSIVNSFMLHLVVTSPTHYSHSQSPSIIDLAFLSHPHYLKSCSTIPPLANSDHMGLLIKYLLPTHIKRPRTVRRTVWCCTRGDFEKACELLRQANWNAVFVDDDVNQCWKRWHNVFLEVMGQCIPQKVLPTRRNLPWINHSLVATMRRRNRLFKKCKLSGSPTALRNYKYTRNKVTAELRKAKRAFLNKLNNADSKSFWKVYKIISKQETNIPCLESPTTGSVTDSHQKANLLNSQFFKNFNHNNIPPYESTLFPIDSSNFPDELLCSEEEIELHLRVLDVKKSSGADGISAVMLKRTAHAIAPSLTTLFNLSLKTGVFPRDWKLARVVPIPKIGAKSNPANYRPISLLPIVSKVLERHVSNIMKNHLTDHSPLSAQQWGFTAKKSTTSALLSFTHNCLESLDNGNEVGAVFFDLSKAFDSVPHGPLLAKIEEIGVSPFLIRWIQSYLSSRSQSVVLDGAESDPLPVISGVPQGSILGPLLFLTYIDKVTNLIRSSNIILYADDIALYLPIKEQSDYSQLQEDVTSLSS